MTGGRPRERRLPLRLTDDQQQLQTVVRDFLARVVPAPTGDRPSWADLDPTGSTWRRLCAELALPGIAVAEELGGQGFGVAELAIVFEELGRVTCPAPLFGSLAVAGRVLAQLPAGDERDRVLSGIAEGSLRATVVTGAALSADGDRVTGTATAVVDAVGADLLVLDVDGDVVTVDAAAAGVTVTAMDGLDLTRPLARVVLDAAPATPVAAGARAAVDRGLAEATVVLAAELSGVAAAALAEAVDYARLRTQFGRPIGSFQALKHRMADVLVAAEGAWSSTRYAALLCDQPDAGPDELTLAVGVAKSAASTAAVFATAEDIQVHGGIGFTWEHPAHLRFRRARSAAALLGLPADHRRRTAAVLTGEGTRGAA
ncbi:acyl-CoA dehydrogenase family protein [Blastococcus sp. SYSU D00820]